MFVLPAGKIMNPFYIHRFATLADANTALANPNLWFSRTKFTPIIKVYNGTTATYYKRTTVGSVHSWTAIPAYTIFDADPSHNGTYPKKFAYAHVKPEKFVFVDEFGNRFSMKDTLSQKVDEQGNLVFDRYGKPVYNEAPSATIERAKYLRNIWKNCAVKNIELEAHYEGDILSSPQLVLFNSLYDRSIVTVLYGDTVITKEYEILDKKTNYKYNYVASSDAGNNFPLPSWFNTTDHQLLKTVTRFHIKAQILSRLPEFVLLITLP